MKLLMLPRYDVLGASSRLRMLQYVPSLREGGFDVTVAPLLGDDYVESMYAGRVSVWRVARSYWRRIRVLRSARRFDVLWVEKELFPWLPAWLERRFVPPGVSVVADYDDAVFHRYDHHASWLVRWLLGRKIDAVMRRATVVTAGNRYLAQRARDAGAVAVEQLPTVVDLDRYPPPTPKANGTQVTVGWIGSPATAHYVSDVGRELQPLAEEGQIRFVAVGARSDQLKGLWFMAQPWSVATEVDQLRGFDIGIMPLPDAPWERGKCGYKLIQYMACGLPVVASPVGVNTEIVEAGENGLLANDVADWTAAIGLLASNAALREQMGQAGRRRVEATYSLQAQAPRLLGMLRDAAARATD